MRIVAVQGSPRKRGNTAKIIDWMGEGFTALGHEFERIDIVDHEVNGCLGCYKCQQASDTLGCVYTDKDDGEMIWNEAIAADITIFATPLYAWCYSGQIKPFLDRGLALVKIAGRDERKSLIAGKRLALVVTCRGGVENNAELMDVLHERYVDYTVAGNAGVHIITSTSSPDALGDEQQELAAGFVGKILSA